MAVALPLLVEPVYGARFDPAANRALILRPAQLGSAFPAALTRRSRAHGFAETNRLLLELRLARR
jgi:hypothetical protein